VMVKVPTDTPPNVTAALAVVPLAAIAADVNELLVWEQVTELSVPVPGPP